MPVVSVIIPSYNRSRLLRQAVLSVLAQTFVDFEVIVVDDGSTDDTREVVGIFTDARVRYVWQENQQRCVARNNGISHAVGEWIALLDSDDLWFPRKLELQLAALGRYPSAGVVYGRSIRVGPSLEFLYRQDFLGSRGEEWCGDLHADLLVANRLSSPAVMVRRELLDRVGGFDAALPHAEDWDMWIRLSSITEFCRVNEPVAVYRVHPGNRTSNPLSTMRGDLIVIDKHHQATDAPARRMRLQAEMCAYGRHGLNALAQGVAEGEEWLVTALDRARDLDESGVLRAWIVDNAVARTMNCTQSRRREARVLLKVQKIAAQHGAGSELLGCAREFWMTWAHACYLLKDYPGCLQSALKVSGFIGDRGLRSIVARSVLGFLSGGSRARFQEELELQEAIGKA